MERNVNMEEISDGKRYGLNDMVKADCLDCKGCHACCEGMGESILLDPLDVYRLTEMEQKTFEELLQHELELNVVKYVILPNIRMGDGKCAFLNQEGRCRIHASRPGICRIFPLGRIYEDGGFSYFLQTKECKMEQRAKVKVKKWIDTPQIRENQKFILDWHNFLKKMEAICEAREDLEERKKINMLFLNHFYIRPYREGDFYEQFYQRMDEWNTYGIG